MKQSTLFVETSCRGLHLITSSVRSAFAEWPEMGMLNCFIHHTSASLLIQENADPTAREDLETFLNRLAPDGESWHRHTLEGPDDTTSHLKSALTSVSLNIPVTDGSLALGTWQGIYLCEHRTSPQRRKLTLTLFGGDH